MASNDKSGLVLPWYAWVLPPLGKRFVAVRKTRAQDPVPLLPKDLLALFDCHGFKGIMIEVFSELFLFCIAESGMLIRWDHMPR